MIIKDHSGNKYFLTLSSMREKKGAKTQDCKEPSEVKNQPEKESTFLLLMSALSLIP